MAEQRQYDEEYKVQAIKLANKIGQTKAAEELGIPKNTLYGWVRKARLGYIDLYWQRRLLFSQRTVGSREKRKNEIHRQQD